ncbi:hypothetical protein F5X68DRAFT_67550 [Plectosphaerella plurivora]|uniref:Uncharacterized protein n=1 Tax=Plectosphaerella plurivora TaxID=936078 RepID=A0A9P8VIF7_9PEZI|nr:hypothetical protein F5X68DRAFT_67550 [Plectosphaerella plurivora]
MALGCCPWVAGRVGFVHCIHPSHLSPSVRHTHTSHLFAHAHLSHLHHPHRRCLATLLSYFARALSSLTYPGLIVTNASSACHPAGLSDHLRRHDKPSTASPPRDTPFQPSRLRPPCLPIAHILSPACGCFVCSALPNFTSHMPLCRTRFSLGLNEI